MWQRLLMLNVQPRLGPSPSRLMLTIRQGACATISPFHLLLAQPTPSSPSSSPSAPAPAPRRPIGSATHTARPSLRRHHVRCFSASSCAPAASVPAADSAAVSAAAADASGSAPAAADADAADSISDAEWAEVEARLMDMAASKNRASGSGVRRNEFELMPVFMQRAGLTPDRLTSLNFIHVAGTKGKGSTCSMVESILRRCGYRTALYTSPHLVDVRERIRVDGRMLPRSEFAAAFKRVYGALREAADRDDPQRGPGMPSFFYFITLMAMDALLSRPPSLTPHVVVLEVGIGGRLDATNAVVTRGSLAAAAVTSLGFDHMEMLGDTLPKIAREKAGIMKAGRPVLVAPQEPDAMGALEEVASRVGAQLVRPPPLDHYSPPGSQAGPEGGGGSDATRGGSSYSNGNGSGSGSVVGLGGEHMRLNAAVAVALAAEWEAQYGAAAAAAAAATAGADAPMAAAVVEAAAGRPVALAPGGPDAASAAARAAAVRSRMTLPAEYLEGLRTVRWPGRSQVVHDEVVASRGGRLTWYLDGAHTPESMAVCADWFAGELKAAAAAARAAGEPESVSGPPAASAFPEHRPPAQRHAAVLLFNCMKERDPGVLLPALAAALAVRQASAAPVAAAQVPLGPQPPPQPQGPAGTAETGVVRQGQFGVTVVVEAAIFTPMLSGGGVLLPAHPGGGDTGQVAVSQKQQPAQHSAADLGWQARMREVWGSCVSGPAARGVEDGGSEGRGGGGGGGAGNTACLHGLPSASVAESLPQAIEAVRAAAAADPRVSVHVLVTGSLYLVGDVLRLLDKPPM